MSGCFSAPLIFYILFSATKDYCKKAQRKRAGAQRRKNIRRFFGYIYARVKAAAFVFIFIIPVFQFTVYLLLRYFLISIAHAARIITPLITYSIFAETERKFSPTNIS